MILTMWFIHRLKVCTESALVRRRSESLSLSNGLTYSSKLNGVVRLEDTRKSKSKLGCFASHGLQLGAALGDVGVGLTKFGAGISVLSAVVYSFAPSVVPGFLGGLIGNLVKFFVAAE